VGGGVGTDGMRRSKRITTEFAEGRRGRGEFRLRMTVGGGWMA
jgi:hypothetical protein